MQLKVFNIRLTKEHLISDQEAINSFLERVSVQKTCEELISGPPNYWSVLVFYEPEQHKEGRSSMMSETEIKNLTPEEQKMYESLKQWRRQKAEIMRLPSFVVCHNFELLMLVKAKPHTIEELAKIRGFGTQKVKLYGEELLMIMHSNESKKH
jgi:superfamily II DNA helicase RecQ